MVSSERKKASSAGLECFQYEINSFTETRLSMAAVRNASSITAQYLQARCENIIIVSVRRSKMSDDS